MKSQKAESEDITALSPGMCFVAFVMVLIGTLIYVFFRRNILFVEWFVGEHHGKFCSWAVENADNRLVHFFVYCLPDALWYAALLVIQYPLSRIGGINRMIYCLCAVMPFVLELAQGLRLMPGTFDMADMLTYILTYYTIILCLKRKSLQHCK